MQVPVDEVHFLGFCETFQNKRQCFLGKLSSLNKSILDLNPIDQIKVMLCPTTPQAAKLVNKYISIMFKARKNIDNGDHILNLTFPPQVHDYVCPDSSFDESNLSISSNSSCSMSETDSD